MGRLTSCSMHVNVLKDMLTQKNHKKFPNVPFLARFSPIRSRRDGKCPLFGFCNLFLIVDVKVEISIQEKFYDRVKNCDTL